MDTSRPAWNVFLGSFVQPISVIVSISALLFDVLATAVLHSQKLSGTSVQLGSEGYASVYPRLSSWHRISGLRMTAYFEAVA